MVDPSLKRFFGRLIRLSFDRSALRPAPYQDTLRHLAEW